MRELMRSVAKSNMKKAGVTRFNKKDGEGKSFFAKNWRTYLGTPVAKKKTKRRFPVRTKFSPGYIS